MYHNQIGRTQDSENERRFRYLGWMLRDFVTAIGGVLGFLIALSIPILGSIFAYHWLDRPDHYVDGRWWTVGCVAFWVLVGSCWRSRN